MNEQLNNGDSKGKWNEAAFAKLLQVYDGEDDAGSTAVTAEVGEEVNKSEPIPTDQVSPNVITQSELFDDPHTGKTQPTLASNPFAKFGTVGLGFGVIFVIGALLINKIMTAPRVAPEMAKTTKQAKPEVVVVDKQEVETGKYKAELALGEQARTIKSFEQNFKTSVKPNSQAKSNKRTIKHAALPSKSVQAFHVFQPIPRREREHPKAIVRPQPTAVPTPPQINQSSDPMQQWLAAANVGNLNLGSNDSHTASVTSQQLPIGGIGVQTVSKNPIGKGTDELTQNTDYSNKQVLVGSRASGILETPIAWSVTGNNNTEQKYLIRLTQPLLASDNSVVVPTDSYIVADFKAANLSEFVQLTAMSVIVNEGNKTIEKPLTENSVLILGKEGKALRGQAKKGSTLGEDFTASILSGISKAADTLNSSEHTISVNGSTTIINSNSNHNIAAGFASGTTQEIVRRMQASNQQRLQELKSEPKVYLIEKGTLVQIFVNQSVLL